MELDSWAEDRIIANIEGEIDFLSCNLETIEEGIYEIKENYCSRCDKEFKDLEKDCLDCTKGSELFRLEIDRIKTQRKISRLKLMLERGVL